MLTAGSATMGAPARLQLPADGLHPWSRENPIEGAYFTVYYCLIPFSFQKVAVMHIKKFLPTSIKKKQTVEGA